MTSYSLHFQDELAHAVVKLALRYVIDGGGALVGGGQTLRVDHVAADN